MSIEFNQELFFKNILFLLKEQKKKIGEFESDTGVSPGYISRTSKERNIKPGIDFIMKAAEMLHVSIDTILKLNLSILTPTERYIVSFLEKLEKDTNNDILNWGIESEEYLNNELETDFYGDTNHPLFELRSNYEKKEDGYQDRKTRILFPSKSYGENTYIDGKCFNLCLSNKAILYIMKIRESDCNIKTPENHSIEIWMHQTKGENKFICGTNSQKEIACLIKNLYSTINDNSRHPKIDKDVRTIIDNFMDDNFKDDDRTNESPKIPF